MKELDYIYFSNFLRIWEYLRYFLITSLAPVFGKAEVNPVTFLFLTPTGCQHFLVWRACAFVQ